MTEFLLAAAGFVLLMVALGLVRILRGPGDAERMMAAQLFGTGGIAALLLLGAATGQGAVVDVAVTLALLAAFASIAFVKAALSDARRRPRSPTTTRRPRTAHERRPRCADRDRDHRRAGSSFSRGPWASCGFPIRSRACMR